MQNKLPKEREREKKKRKNVREPITTLHVLGRESPSLAKRLIQFQRGSKPPGTSSDELTNPGILTAL